MCRPESLKNSEWPRRRDHQVVVKVASDRAMFETWADPELGALSSNGRPVPGGQKCLSAEPCRNVQHLATPYPRPDPVPECRMPTATWHKPSRAAHAAQDST